MSTTALILRAELLNARHWLLDTKQGRSAGIGIALAAVLLGPLLLGAASVGGFALGDLGIDPAGIFAGGFSAVAMLMFLFGLPGIISAFFADRQLLLYAAAPISSLQLFVARLVQASLPAALIGVVVLAAVFGYGIGAHLNPAFGLLAIVLVAALALTVVSVEVCVMSLVLRVVPATRARDVAGVMLALLASSFYFLQFALRGQVGTIADDPTQALKQASALGGILIWLPTSWPAEALAAWAVQGPLQALGWTAVTLAAAAAAVAAGWVLHKQTFVLGLGVFGEAGAGPARRRRSRARPTAARAAPPNPVAAIAWKDYLGLRRDFRRLAGVLPAVGMAVVYAFVNSGHAVGGAWGVVLPIGFVPGFVSLAVAVPAIGTEGRGIQLLVLAGLPMRKLLLAKLLFALPIVVLLTTWHGARALGDQQRRAGRRGDGRGLRHLARLRRARDRGRGRGDRAQLRGHRSAARREPGLDDRRDGDDRGLRSAQLRGADRLPLRGRGHLTAAAGAGRVGAPGELGGRGRRDAAGGTASSGALAARRVGTAPSAPAAAGDQPQADQEGDPPWTSGQFAPRAPARRVGALGIRGRGCGTASARRRMAAWQLS